jgi:hypothetical protein
MEDVRLEFADNFIVQHDQDGFFLTFFQLQHPIAFTPESRANIKEIQLKCVSKVFLTPTGLSAVIEALIENKKNYEAKFTYEEVEVQIDEENAGQHTNQPDIDRISNSPSLTLKLSSSASELTEADDE